jgi:hypothetical protein
VSVITASFAVCLYGFGGGHTAKGKQKGNEMTLKLEVGKYYRNREGGLKEIISFYDVGGLQPFIDKEGECYTAEGFFIGKNINHAYDLIEEVVISTPDELAALKAENERLRKAIKRALDYNQGTNNVTERRESVSKTLIEALQQGNEA